MAYLQRPLWKVACKWTTVAGNISVLTISWTPWSMERMRKNIDAFSGTFALSTQWCYASETLQGANSKLLFGLWHNRLPIVSEIDTYSCAEFSCLLVNGWKLTTLHYCSLNSIIYIHVHLWELSPVTLALMNMYRRQEGFPTSNLGNTYYSPDYGKATQFFM